MTAKNLIIILTVLIVFFFSCTQTAEKQFINNNIIGQWTIDSISIHAIHGVIKVPLADSFSIPPQTINTQFAITLKEDSSFIFNNENGSTEVGTYKITNNVSNLILNKASNSWLNFHIDSITNTKFFLASQHIQFYTNTADSIHIFTAANVYLILKRDN